MRMSTLTELFADLEPIPQDEGPEPIVRIAYPEGFQTVMDYFRRVLVNGEYSERTLKLSGEVIARNAANYTAWQFRRKCIEVLHADATPEERQRAWRDELEYCGKRGLENLKNYQVWFHRRSCVSNLGDGSRELAFVEEILGEDSKNYHAWGYRQWVLARFGLWEGELDFIGRLLREDVRNNSAWNQRYFVLKATADLASPELLAAEVEFAEGHIELSPTNPSPWNYLRGLLEPVGYDAVPRVRAMCEERAAAGGAQPGSDGGRVMAMGLLVDVLLASGSREELDRARALCKALGEMDPIRAAYWRWRGSRIGV